MNIFMSYTSRDQAAAEALKSALIQQGASSVFYAPESLRGGMFWLPELAERMAQASACVALLGEGEPGLWQLIEYQDAFKRRVETKGAFKLVPVILGEKVQGFPYLQHLHWVRIAGQAGPEAAARVLEALAGAEGAPPPEPWRSINPFHDLNALGEADCELFFGRERETAETIDAIAAAPDKAIVLVGNSGTGKSSLVKAGVIPALRRQVLPRRDGGWSHGLRDSRTWLVLTMKPGELPFAALADAFIPACGLNPADPEHRAKASNWAKALARGEMKLTNLIESAFEAGRQSGREPAEILLHIDQGEELYANPMETVRRFSSELAAALQRPRFRVLMSLRSDRYDKLQADMPLFAHTQRIDVAPLGAGAMAEIMVEAAKALRAKFVSDELPTRIAAEVADEPGGIALLSVYMSDLWKAMQAKGDGVLRLPDTEVAINVGAALNRRALSYWKANPALQPAIKSLLIDRLVRLPKDGPPLRRRARVADLDADQRHVLNALASGDWRLLATAGEGEAATAEVAHEVLFTAWMELKSWIDGRRGALEWKDAVESRRRAWEGSGRKRSDLLGGSALIEARLHAPPSSALLEAPDRDYVQTSKRWQAQKVGAGFAVVVLFISALVAALYNVYQAKQSSQDRLAESQRRESLFLAEKSNDAAKEHDYVRAIAVALEGMPDEMHQRPRIMETATALYTGFINLREQFVLKGHEGAVTSAAFSPDGSRILTASGDKTARLWDAKGTELAVLKGHEGPVVSAVFSGDGSRILTASGDNTARLWDAKGTELAVLKGHEGNVYSAVFSPDGSRILTASSDNTARLWDAKGTELAVLKGHEAPVSSAVFSGDGSRILTASLDNTARLWDAKGTELAVLKGHEGDVYSAVFSPDGSRILTASDDNTARLWDAKGTELAVLKGHEAPVSSAVFSGDGSRILTASSDNTARLWDARGTELAVLKGHEGRVTSAVFSPDGSRILTASSDNTARLWDAKGIELAMLKGHEGTVRSAVFSGDGSRILTASYDSTARLWDAKGTELAVLKGHELFVNSAVFSGDGSRILTASDDNTARLWDAKGAELAVLKGHENGVNSAVFSPDGSRILTASWDNTARLWDAKGTELAVLKGHEDDVTSAVFSGDGSRILTASEDKTARLWDAKGTELAVLKGHEGDVYSAIFSPDGSRTLTASYDKTARLWDAKGNELAVLKGHENGVNSAVFSPDGSRILTASWDNTARLWDAKGTELAVLKGHEGRVTSAIFSPDGSRILTASDDNTARLWDATGAELAVLKGHEGFVWSAAFSPDDSRILTASQDNTARLWDAKGTELAVLKGHKGNVTSAVFSGDGSRILTASSDATAWLRPIYSDAELVKRARERLPRCLTAKNRAELFLEPIIDIDTNPDYCRTPLKEPAQ